MGTYIPLSDYGKLFNIKEGDNVFISSDAKTLLLFFQHTTGIFVRVNPSIINAHRVKQVR